MDYMAGHLKAGGRAGIIVPEGIIFQSQKAQKQLRKMLVEECLVAVVSLPRGVFNPYSGVKTSILLLDKVLARNTERIAFFKVENDGYDLGAQRHPIEGNELPQVRDEIVAYLQQLRAGDSQPAAVALAAERGAEYAASGTQPKNGLIVEKERVAENGEFNLSGERYRKTTISSSSFPIVALGDVAEIISGQSPPGKSYNGAGVGTPFYQGKTEFGDMFIGEPVKWTTDPRRFAEQNDILMSVRAPVGPVNIAMQRICIGRGLAAIKPRGDRLHTAYAFYILRAMESEITGSAGAAFASINKGDIEKIQIPLPHLDVQQEIVAEIEVYQKVIDGARAVVENYRPHIHVDPDWPTHFLGELSENLDSRRVPISKAERKKGPFPYYGASGVVDYVDNYIFDEEILLISEDGANLLARSTPIAFSVSGKCWVNNHAHVLKLQSLDMLKWIEIYLNSINLEYFVTGSAQPKLNQRMLSSIPIPVPYDPASLRAMISEIENEQTLVEANRELIERFESKIQDAIARVWGNISGRS